MELDPGARLKITSVGARSKLGPAQILNPYEPLKGSIMI